jgi:hypothetical protein
VIRGVGTGAHRPGASQDLEVADNRDRVVVFTDVRPDAQHRLEVDVAVSPDGTARFAYLGSLVLTRTGP